MYPCNAVGGINVNDFEVLVVLLEKIIRQYAKHLSYTTICPVSANHCKSRYTYLPGNTLVDCLTLTRVSAYEYYLPYCLSMARPENLPR